MKTLKVLGVPVLSAAIGILAGFSVGSRKDDIVAKVLAQSDDPKASPESIGFLEMIGLKAFIMSNDTNRDGKLSPDELAPYVIKNNDGDKDGKFSTTELSSYVINSNDKDKDGKLSPEEFAAYIRKTVDLNDDGEISPDELAAYIGKIFDRDGDGFISPVELKRIK